MSNYLKYILMLLIVTVATFSAHYLVLSGMNVDHFWDQTSYTLVGLYGFAFVASLIVTVVVFMAKWAMPEKLGFIFLGLTVVKTVASYIFIQSGLNKFENDFIEYNFLVSFFVYLFFDVFIAFKALNQEDGRV